MGKPTTKTASDVETENSAVETALATRNKESSLIFDGSFDKLLETEEMNVRHVVTLKPGQGIVGEYRGEGDGMEFTDPSTGEVRHVKTFVIAVLPRLEAEIIGCHQIERKLSKAAIGKRIAIKHAGQQKTRMGRTVNDYLVAVQP